jgi:ABC-2 type transport system permease protein
VKTLKHYLKIYWLLFSLHIKTRMEYRVDFAMGLVGMLFVNLLGALTLWIIFHSIPGLAGWSYHELIFIYAFALLSMLPTHLLFDNLWQLNNKLMEGSFIKYYFRPLDILFYFISEKVDVKSFGQFIVACIMLVYSSGELGVVWGPGNTCVFLFLLASASLVMMGMMLLASALSFWFLNANFALSFAHKLTNFSHFPMNIYNNIFKFLFSFIIPIGYLAFYPAQLILRSGEADIYAYISPLIGAALFGIAYHVWIRGAMKYGGTGS